MAQAPSRKPLHVTTPEEAEKVARANLLRNQTRARNAGKMGWIIRAPVYGTPVAAALAQTTVDRSLQIHRHNIITKRSDEEPDEDGITKDQYRTFEGVTLTGVDGQWFTTDEDVANYVKKEYVPRGYTIIDVGAVKDSNILESMAFERALSIVDSGNTEGEDLDLDEAHPDTPKIMV